MNNATIREVFGNRFVEGVSVDHNGSVKRIPVQGVFIEVGLIPNSEFTSSVKKNKWGEIIVDNRNCTNIPNIFAAGDVTDVPEKQIIIAAGEGSKALLTAYNYLARQK
jgi:alkyl hydroperoxide reductase subunit F